MRNDESGKRDGNFNEGEPSTPDDAKGKRLLESMGWLTESILIPRKGKTIEGVGAQTLIDLKAQLALSQEQAQLEKDSGEIKKGRKRKNEDDGLFKEMNRGVLERDKKDRLQLKTQEDMERDSHLALESKAELYDKIVCREVESNEEMKDQYQVNFLRKQYMHELEGNKTDSEIEVSVEDEERKRRRELVMEQAGLTKKGREKASQIKEARLQQQRTKREQLKSAFLKKQVAKLKEQKQNQNEGHSKASLLP